MQTRPFDFDTWVNEEVELVAGFNNEPMRVVDTMRLPVERITCVSMVDGEAWQFAFDGSFQSNNIGHPMNLRMVEIAKGGAR